jgi:hypothetical protein
MIFMLFRTVNYHGEACELLEGYTCQSEIEASYS